MRPRTDEERQKRDDHMLSAEEVAVRVCREAELRGMPAQVVAISMAAVIAARNPELCGEALMAIEASIKQQPITKVIKPDTDLVKQPDGSYGPAN